MNSLTDGLNVLRKERLYCLLSKRDIVTIQVGLSFLTPGKTKSSKIKGVTEAICNAYQTLLIQ